jgi:hypothetical protein
MLLTTNIIEKKSVILSVLLIILLLMTSSYPAYADDGLEIVSIEGGFDGMHKINGWTPFIITLKNNGNDFNGEIQVIADSMMYEFKSAYSLPVNLAKGGEKQVIINAPVNRTRASVDVQIIQNNKVIKEQKYYFKKSLNPNTLLIGALADDMSGLRYLSGGNFGNQNISIQSEIVQLNEKNFPQNDKVLNNFNVLIINNYDTTVLSDEQKQRLIQWVEDGGLLILGTGPNYKKVLNGLPQELKLANVKSEETLKSFTAFEQYTGKKNFPDSAGMPIVALDTKAGNVLLKQNEFPLIISKEFGKGFIGYFAFDSGLEPFSTWDGGNQVVWQNIINSTIGNDVRGEIWNPKMQYEFYHAMNNALRFIPSVEMPSLVLLLVIIGTFIIVAGPVNYLVLKKKDKREWSWITIPAIVAIFSLGIYIIGFGTRFSTAVCSIVSIIEFKNDSKSVDVTAHTGLFNPKRGTLKIHTSKDVDVDFTVNPYIDTRYMGPPEEREKKIISKYILGDQPAVEFYDKSIWDFSSFIMNKKVSFSDNVNNSVLISNNTVKGRIKNNTGFKIQDAFIVIGNSYVKIGDIDIAQTKEINEQLIQINSAKNDYYQLLNSIFGQNWSQPGIKRDDKWKLNNQRRSAFEYYSMVNRTRTDMSSKPVLYGWSDADLQFDVFANDKPAKKYYQNMIVMPMELNFIKGESIQLPYGFVNSVVDSTEGNARINPDPYNRGGVNIEGEGKAIFKFSVPAQVSVRSFTINWFAPPYMRLQGNNRLLIYNFNKTQWEDITSYYYIDSEIASNYVSTDNEIKVMFDSGDEANQNVKGKGFFGMIPSPDIELEGVIR